MIKKAPEKKLEKPSKKAPNVAKAGTKLQRLEVMLRRPEGATLKQLALALEWQPHSIRGAMSGSLKKKRGIKISAEDVMGGERTYRIPN